MQAAFSDIPLPEELRDKDKVYIRIVATSDKTVGGGVLTENTAGGEAAINDIVLNGDMIEEAVTSDEVYVDGTPYRLEKADGSDYETLVYDNSVSHVIINQLYGNDSGKEPNPVSNSFIELYNPTDAVISLDGWALHYKSGKEGDTSYYWDKFEFKTGAVIPAHSSYLVKCNLLKPNTDGSPQYVISEEDAEWEISLCNKGGSVVLTCNTDILPVNSKVYDNRKKCPVIDGYVDMLAVSGNDGKETQQAPAYEGSASYEQSKKKSVRRIGFKDTDNNSTDGGDCMVIDYSFGNQEYIDWAAPRSSNYGVWEASPCPTYKVSFNMNDGTDIVIDKSFDLNTKPAAIDDPVWEDHTFMGWYSNVGCSEKFDFGNKPTGDVSIYAGWKITDVSNAPDSSMPVENTVKKLGDAGLPEGWEWDEAKHDIVIPAGGEVTADAFYTGADKEAYYNTIVTVTVSRGACTPGEVTYTGVGEHEPTCTVEGLGHKECTVCGDVIETGIETDKVPHMGGTANCHSGAICEQCHNAYGEPDESNHDGGTELREVKAAECEAEGYTGDTYCKGCDTKLSDGKVVEALGHTGGTATCHSGAICEQCHNAYGEPDESNHDGGTELREVKTAECEAEGYTGDTYCKGCDTKLSDGKVVEALGHTGGTVTCHTKAVCERCNKPYGEYAVTNHDGGTELRGTVTAGYETEGYTGDTYCKGCNTKLKAGEKIPVSERPSDEEPIPVTSQGDKVVSNGCNYTVLKTASSGKGTVEFTGMADKGTVKTAKIPDSITINGSEYKVVSIGKKAFKGNKKLKKVIIGDNVTAINDYAFYKASALQTVEIGKGLTKIGKHAFSYDKKLKKVTIKSRKLKTVKGNVFKGVKNVRIVVDKNKKKQYKKLLKR